MWINTFQVVVGSKRGSYIKILHSTVRDACIHGNWHAHVDFSFIVLNACAKTKQVRARSHQMHVPKQNNTPEDKTKVEGNWI
ncbi:unnamed protein product [Prunus brigantina]